MPQADGTGLARVASLGEVPEGGRKVVKVGAKQIALFRTDQGLFACNNRCPHEGYPLVEGSLGQGCVLTCNWHNWKFDLANGETLIGGDRLRRYPVEVRGGEIWLDVTDPPEAERAAAALESLRDSFGRHEYDRMAREISRLHKAGADPLDALRAAIVWTHDRLEFGTTHAYAAAPDWLALRDRFAGAEAALALVPVTETVGHMAWDTRREPVYPYAAEILPYSAASLVAAIESEDEATAVGLLRGALAEGLTFGDLGRPLAEAALAHYQDFGHSAIYVVKTGQLIDRLGSAAAEPLLLALVRSLVTASREDLIPEFRDYGAVLAAWDPAAGRPAAAEDFVALPVRKALERTAESAADPEALYGALLGAAAWQMLHFDLPLQDRTDGPVSRNVGWLDFTHAITFANAVRTLCGRYPDLWPRGLLQMACFLGRNAGYLDRDLDTAPWRVEDAAAFLDGALERLFDHGQFEYIVACHQLKTLTAAREEIEANPDASWVPNLAGALKRFLDSPLKRKHALRTARQAMAFVAAED